jgi:hypothetical protein
MTQVLVSHILMYLTKDEIKNLLGECYRILGDNSRLIITEDNVHLKIRDGEQQKQYGNGILFNSEEMMDILGECGFMGVKRIGHLLSTKHHIDPKENYPLAQGLTSVYCVEGTKKRLGHKIVYLTLDDFGESNTSFDLLWRLRNYFDDFRVNLCSPFRWNERKEWLSYLNSLSWIQLCHHGYDHERNEELDNVSLDILSKDPYYAKVYKAPFWELSDDMYTKLQERGFKILLHKDDPREGIKYNWEIDYEIPREEMIHGYGHIYQHDYLSHNGNKGSSLFHYFKNVMKLPIDTDFRFY